MQQEERRRYMIGALLRERGDNSPDAIPPEEEQQWRLLRGLMNVRPPAPVSQAFLQVQDAYLQEHLAERGVTCASDLRPLQEGICLWRGDITTLRCGAIVNAANSGMTGCYQPCHGCIDNAIHTFAGVQLRLKCAELMACQGCEEPVGRAKITPAYNLPLRLRDPHCGPHGAGQADTAALPAAGGLLPGLLAGRGGKQRGEYRLLLHLHGGVHVPRGQGGGDCGAHGAALPG